MGTGNPLVPARVFDSCIGIGRQKRAGPGMGFLARGSCTFKRERTLLHNRSLVFSRTGAPGSYAFHGLSGEFDPGSERTLAACLTHASRARKGLRLQVKRRTGE